jgi:CheY-like chemotaxis protein
MNILLVEDSSFLRAAIAKALKRAGHNVTGVGDGRKVLLAACVGAPDIILLDMMLPGLDGLAVLKELKGNLSTATTPILVLTGLSQKNESRLKKAGAAAFLEKDALDLENGAPALLVAIDNVMATSIAARPQPALTVAALVQSDPAPEITLIVEGLERPL